MHEQQVIAHTDFSGKFAPEEHAGLWLRPRIPLICCASSDPKRSVSRPISVPASSAARTAPPGTTAGSLRTCRTACAEREIGTLRDCTRRSGWGLPASPQRVVPVGDHRPCIAMCTTWPVGWDVHTDGKAVPGHGPRWRNQAGCRPDRQTGFSGSGLLRPAGSSTAASGCRRPDGHFRHTPAGCLIPAGRRQRPA